MGLKSWLRGSEDPWGIGFDPVTPLVDAYTGGSATMFRSTYGKAALKLWDVKKLASRAKRRYRNARGQVVRSATAGSIFEALHG